MSAGGREHVQLCPPPLRVSTTSTGSGRGGAAARWVRERRQCRCVREQCTPDPPGRRCAASAGGQGWAWAAARVGGDGGEECGHRSVHAPRAVIHLPCPPPTLPPPSAASLAAALAVTAAAPHPCPHVLSLHPPTHHPTPHPHSHTTTTRCCCDGGGSGGGGGGGARPSPSSNCRMARATFSLPPLQGCQGERESGWMRRTPGLLPHAAAGAASSSPPPPRLTPNPTAEPQPQPPLPTPAHVATCLAPLGKGSVVLSSARFTAL